MATEKASTKAAELVSVLITTEWRGVFYAEVDPRTDFTQRTLTNLRNVRMAIYWGTTRGVQELAHTGPTSKSRIAAPSDWPVVHGVTGVQFVTDEARAKWIAAS